LGGGSEYRIRQAASKYSISATMLGEIDKYDPDCKDAYKEASEKILDMTNDDYKRELKKLLKLSK
jgi:hypothetical protein